MPARTSWRRASAALVAVAAIIVLVASCSALGSLSSAGSGPTANNGSGSAANGGSVDSIGSQAADSSSPAAPTQSSAPSGPPYPIGSVKLTVDEPNRTVTVDGQTGERVIPTLVRYPARTGQAGQDKPGASPLGGTFPLVVFAPGYLQCGSTYGPLLRSWAAAGFIVAEVTFPLTNCHVAQPRESDILNEPYDISSVITQLLADNADPGSPLYEMINPKKVAVAGHSDGGDTAAAVAFNTCCRDARVSAALIFAGAELSSFGGSYFPQGSPPALFVQGGADTVNVPTDTLKLYDADQAGPKALLWLDGGTHLSPYEGSGPAERIVARVTTDFLRMTLLGSSQAAKSMAQEGDVSGRSNLTTSRMPSVDG